MMTGRHRNQKPDGPLSPAGRNAVVEGFLFEFPRPVAMASFKFPEFTRAAVIAEGWDEVNSACLFAVVNAARLYDPAKGVEFKTFAGHHLRAAVKGLLVIPNRDRDRLGDRRVESVDHLHADRREEREGDPEDAVGVARVMTPLGEWSRRLLERVYGIGQEPEVIKAIAAEMGMSVSTLRYRREKILDECRRTLGLVRRPTQRPANR